MIFVMYSLIELLRNTRGENHGSLGDTCRLNMLFVCLRLVYNILSTRVCLPQVFPFFLLFLFPNPLVRTMGYAHTARE